MLLWAVFTLGYLFGVFFTLGVFLKKEVVEGLYEEDLFQKDLEGKDAWEIHSQLIEPNVGVAKKSRDISFKPGLSAAS